MLRREKEMLKVLAQQERQATRSRHRDAHAGPRDDLDLEMEALLVKQQHSHPGYAILQNHVLLSRLSLHVPTMFACLENVQCICHPYQLNPDLKRGPTSPSVEYQIFGDCACCLSCICKGSSDDAREAACLAQG